MAIAGNRMRDKLILWFNQLFLTFITIYSVGNFLNLVYVTSAVKLASISFPPLHSHQLSQAQIFESLPVYFTDI